MVEATVEAEVGRRSRRAVKREGIIGDRNCSRNGFGKLKGTSEISDLSIGEKVRRQQSFWTNIRQQRFWIPTVAYSPFRNSTTFRKDLGRRRRTKIQKTRKNKQKKEQKNLLRGESYYRLGIVWMYTFIFSSPVFNSVV